MIKINKPKFWDKKSINFFSLILLPLSLITLFLVFSKKIFGKKKIFNIPIICIGNIYIGGTGKTPTAILIAKELLNSGVKSAILCKYYRGHIDEYKLIKNNFKDLILNKNRVEGIIEAEKKGYEILILDDGLQEYKIKKDCSIVCFNHDQKIGNGFVLPAGPLRESLRSLENANIVLINGSKDLNFEKKLFEYNKKIQIYYSNYKPTNLDKFKNHKLLALAGIANPENFFKLLEKNNLQIEERLIFPDHYNFTKEEIVNIINKAEKKKLKIIMTEKDYFKINDYNLNKLDYLKVNLEIHNKVKFFESVRKLYD